MTLALIIISFLLIVFLCAFLICIIILNYNARRQAKLDKKQKELNDHLVCCLTFLEKKVYNLKSEVSEPVAHFGLTDINELVREIKEVYIDK